MSLPQLSKRSRPPYPSSRTTTLLRRVTPDDMITGSTDDGKSSGRPGPATNPVGGGGGHPTGMQTSPVVAALVAVAVILLASLVFWWIVARIRRSRRGVPLELLVAKRTVDKPILSDVALIYPHMSKDLCISRWEKLSPVSVDCVSEDDKRRWQSISQLALDDASLSASSESSRSTKSKVPFERNQVYNLRAGDERFSRAGGEHAGIAIISSYNRILVENYCIIASSGELFQHGHRVSLSWRNWRPTVLLFADTLTTFTDEVQRIWGRRFSGATAVFLLTRYVAVAERTALVVSVFLPTVQDKVCVQTNSSGGRFTDTVFLDRDISYLLFGVFMMLRTRGIWGYGWLPIVILALLTPVRTIITAYVQTKYIPIAFGAPLYGCGANYAYVSVSMMRSHIPSNADYTVGIASRATALTIDTVVLVVTWMRTLSIKRESNRLGMHTPLVTLLLRDGTIYFLSSALLVPRMVTLTTFILWDIWPYFDQVFTVIFCCRFMLSLRGVYLSQGTPATALAEGDDSGEPSSAYFSSMRFSSSVVGNMGAPLDTFSVGSKDHYIYPSYTSPSTGAITEEDDADADVDVDRARRSLGDVESPGPEVELHDPLQAGLRRPGSYEMPRLDSRMPIPETPAKTPEG
ncbi:hypothetical protein C8Q77DRAFT_1076640 [Trametes polyzona]|nr:hypothetical protein C8Q77DRAFT_1076640 [Trametes polyzona]